LLSVGQGFASPTMSASIANRISPEKRGEVLGVQQSWSALARVIGPLSGGWAFDHIGVSAPFVAGAAVFAVAASVLFTVPGDKNRAFARS
jgi:MFS transporter, DHA1 family, tetracycline resistance protein